MSSNKGLYLTNVCWFLSWILLQQEETIQRIIESNLSGNFHSSFELKITWAVPKITWQLPHKIQPAHSVERFIQSTQIAGAQNAGMSYWFMLWSLWQLLRCRQGSSPDNNESVICLFPVASDPRSYKWYKRNVYDIYYILPREPGGTTFKQTRNMRNFSELFFCLFSFLVLF